jgi:class 3 adenylate cyclase/tetratricopeptide (TPR) repeat protein
MPMVCPRCGEENPDRARFCMVCAEPLVETAPAREERKVVSVLFVDLVGFTAASETADPEDVRARLHAYHTRAKAEVERFGGTIEKFVGDAIMSVFGAPVAHEDDAERAVRAGLAILVAMEGLELEARAAVNSGEALVALSARPELGEGIATGDVVNTAARLQSSAPQGALVAGEQTYWATRHAIDYEPLDPVQAKGKADPVPLWRAVGARSRFGIDLEPARETPFLGRDDELEVLRQVYARTLRESACHLVTLVGEPGIGKSRLVAELREFVDGRPELIYWRQGRCLPYGEGIALWALGEIVKAHAGILESDDPAAAREKLARAIEPLVSAAAEQAWIAGELARLVGAGPAAAGERDESFAAWRSFLEAVAAQRPLVLVVEDLHWADGAMLEFLEHLVDWATGVTLLVVCTARPELHELHPAWSGGTRNATTISLSPLSSDDTARLVAALLERAVLPAETQRELLERAGGNPLYAEQFVKMLQERPRTGDVAVPETVQALIAARLDTLGADRKALLQDASVVGKVFWSGAVGAVGGLDDRAVREGLHELVRRELVRPSRLSSVEGQAEFAFGHGLVRDVAYAQIPRADRVRMHEAAAQWIEGIAGERVADHAELLAHHYREALALARAAGLESARLEDGARRFLMLAAEKAAAIDLLRAEALFAEALELTPRGHPARGRLLTTSVELAGRFVDREIETLEDAIAELSAAGDEVGLGKAKLVLSHRAWIRGEAARASQVLDDAVELLERHEPGPELAHAYSFSAGREAIGGDAHGALDWAKKATALAERLGLEEIAQQALQFRGIARSRLGDPGGVDDLRDSLNVSLERGLTRAATIAFNNYASWVWLTAGAAEALPIYEKGIEFVERRAGRAMWHRGESTWPLFDLGRWDELLETVRVIEVDQVEGQPGLMALTSKGRVLFYRGQTEEAAAISSDLLSRARAVGDAQILLPALALAALVEPRPDAALALVAEMLAVDAPENPLYPDSARVCLRHGAPELAQRMIRADERAAPRARHVGATVRAILAERAAEDEEAARLYVEAAELWQRYPFVLERAQCLLGAARCRLAFGDEGGVREQIEEARALFRSLGAGLLEREAAELLERIAA